MIYIYIYNNRQVRRGCYGLKRKSRLMAHTVKPIILPGTEECCPAAEIHRVFDDACPEVGGTAEPGH